jgi:hypothetical protein
MNGEKRDSPEQSSGGANSSKTGSTEAADRNADGDPSADGCPPPLGGVSTIRRNHERTSFIVMATFLGAFAASLGVTARSNCSRKKV